VPFKPFIYQFTTVPFKPSIYQFTTVPFKPSIYQFTTVPFKPFIYRFTIAIKYDLQILQNLLNLQNLEFQYLLSLCSILNGTCFYTNCSIHNNTHLLIKQLLFICMYVNNNLYFVGNLVTEIYIFRKLFSSMCVW